MDSENKMEQLELVEKMQPKIGAEEAAEQKIENSGLNGDVISRPSQRIHANGRRNPPARNTSRFWFERFLSVIQRQNPLVIDSSFLRQIAPSNEGKLLAQLKFLRVIDEQGKPSQLLSALNMVGEEQKKGFQQVAKEAYSDLISELVVEKAVPDDLVNFFIRKYTFTRDKAVNAAKFFLYLAEKGSISVSPELSAFLTEKVPPIASQLGSTLSSQSFAKAPAMRNQSLRTYASLATQKKSLRNEVLEEQPLIQATINISLDKDTPREYWDRILALLGERKDNDLPDRQIAANADVEERSEKNHREE